MMTLSEVTALPSDKLPSKLPAPDYTLEETTNFHLKNEFRWRSYLHLVIISFFAGKEESNKVWISILLSLIYILQQTSVTTSAAFYGWVTSKVVTITQTVFVEYASYLNKLNEKRKTTELMSGWRPDVDSCLQTVTTHDLSLTSSQSDEKQTLGTKSHQPGTPSFCCFCFRFETFVLIQWTQIFLGWVGRGRGKDH